MSIDAVACNFCSLFGFYFKFYEFFSAFLFLDSKRFVVIDKKLLQ